MEIESNNTQTTFTPNTDNPTTSSQDIELQKLEELRTILRAKLKAHKATYIEIIKCDHQIEQGYLHYEEAKKLHSEYFSKINSEINSYYPEYINTVITLREFGHLVEIDDEFHLPADYWKKINEEVKTQLDKNSEISSISSPIKSDELESNDSSSVFRNSLGLNSLTASPNKNHHHQHQQLPILQNNVTQNAPSPNYRGRIYSEGAKKSTQKNNSQLSQNLPTALSPQELKNQCAQQKQHQSLNNLNPARPTNIFQANVISDKKKWITIHFENGITNKMPIPGETIHQTLLGIGRLKTYHSKLNTMVLWRMYESEDGNLKPSLDSVRQDELATNYSGQHLKLVTIDPAIKKQMRFNQTKHTWKKLPAWKIKDRLRACRHCARIGINDIVRCSQCDTILHKNCKDAFCESWDVCHGKGEIFNNPTSPLGPKRISVNNEIPDPSPIDSIPIDSMGSSPGGTSRDYSMVRKKFEIIYWFYFFFQLHWVNKSITSLSLQQ